jgi:hypothetical protein
MNQMRMNSVSANPKPDDSSVNPTVCIANIGPQQQRLRLNFGLAMFAIAVAIAAVMILVGINPAWRIALFLPFYLGATGYFQARDKT